MPREASLFHSKCIIPGEVLQTRSCQLVSLPKIDNERIPREVLQTRSCQLVSLPKIDNRRMFREA